MYITKFEELAWQAGYTLGSLKSIQLFEEGLSYLILANVIRAPTVSKYYAIKERATHSAMAQRKLVAKRTPGRGVPFTPFQNRKPNYNFHSNPTPQQWQYNLSNAPLSINDTLIPIDVGRAQLWNWRAWGRGNPRGQWKGQVNIADTGPRNNNAFFSYSELGHFAKNFPQCQGKGKGGAKANLINFNLEEYTLYKGSQAERSRVALVKMKIDAMSFDERQELIKELAGEEGKDFHSA
jgi:hypothetical protein